MESIFKTRVEKIIIDANCTNESIKLDYENYKNALDEDKINYDFSEFVGGWEIEDSIVPDTVVSELPNIDEAGEEILEQKLYSETFVHRFNLDKSKVFIFFGDPFNGKQCLSKSTNTFIKLADELGIDKVYTKSDMQTLLNSVDYIVSSEV